MKLSYLLPSFLILAVSATGFYFLSGNKAAVPDSASHSSSEVQGLSAFMQLHSLYCERSFRSREDLITSLVDDDRFRPSKDYNGVFEITLNGFNYAISPEEDGCTTDVLVKLEDAEAMFSYQEVTQNLMRRGYETVGSDKSRKDTGMDEKEVTVMERILISPQGEKARLAFPIDRPDQYYMTLYTKKFPEQEKVITDDERALTLKK